MARALASLDRRAEALPWNERVIKVAERLDLMDLLTGALIGRGQLLLTHDRPREGLLLLRGGHAMALSGGFRDRERGARTLLTFNDQWDNPDEGMQLAREGFEIAHQIGSLVYGWAMVGNGVVNGLRVGEWDWAAALLEEWIALASATGETPSQVAEFYVDRAILSSLRGGDPSADIELATTRRAGITDPQYESYDAWARAWAAFSAGRFDEARREGLRAAETTSYFHPLTMPLAARAALWAGDPAAARDTLERLGKTMFRGQALALDKASVEAGIAALEGHTAEALTLYRDALRGWRDIKCAWDEALTVVDMVNFLGAAESDARTAAEWARTTLARLGAQPFLDRLETGLADKGKRAAAKPAAGPHTRTETAAG
ncbi:MAG: hypothetical protein QFC55_08015 [Chloroflexota bacterium]|nr:hypothetical protein [Chloroflexota bacterium]